MCGNLLCLAVVLVGIDAGWQPSPQGGMQYLIQIEPELFDRLKSGEVEEITSDIPPQVQDIRTYRITVGSAQLPRELPPAGETETPAAAAPADPSTTEANKLPMDPFRRGPTTFSNTPSTADEIPPFGPPPVDAQTIPRPLYPDPTGKPIELRQAGHVSPPSAGPKPGAEPDSTLPEQRLPAEDEPPKPWLAMTLTLLALFASLGGNIFLGWVTWDTRTRFRALVSGSSISRPKP
ncbi:MAG: hypothetical protein JXB62_01840 [Pirellulales bacterium]|nr:hypothetical protein [Pirellulales bacterium]